MSVKQRLEVYFKRGRSIIPASSILQSIPFMATHSNQEAAMSQQPDSAKPKLLDQVGATIRLRGMSYQTEKAYIELCGCG